MTDPIHYFNERGHSTLSADFLHAENDRLRKEIDERDRKIRSLTMRLAMLADSDDQDEAISFSS